MLAHLILCQLCAANHSFYEFMNALALSYPEDSSIPTLLPYFYPFPNIPEPCKKVIRYRWSRSNISLSLFFFHFDQLWTDVLTVLSSLAKWAFLMRNGSFSKDKCLQLSLIVCSFSAWGLSVSSPAQVYRQVYNNSHEFFLWGRHYIQLESNWLPP